ncbi:MAG: CHAT domain-containing protein [Vulcanococcus sp.]|uniref:CHAT domain-containing protein n=1 Tax=Vulcanococcus sp. TaxID=2856995 RepID=UPI0025D9CEE2|nr:CHAT domain-containing protein [Vulcanococcus sp.]MBW0181802.1 CHAT domain-containing protein [Vulcanococcus sp.]
MRRALAPAGFWGGLAALALAVPAQAEVAGQGGSRSLGTLINGERAGRCTAGVCVVGGGTRAGDNLFHRLKAFDTRGAITGVRFQNQRNQTVIVGVANPFGSWIDKTIKFENPGNLLFLSPGGIRLGAGAGFQQINQLGLSTATRLAMQGGGSFDVFRTTAFDAATLVGTPLFNAQGLHVDADARQEAGITGVPGIVADGIEVTVDQELFLDAMDGAVQVRDSQITVQPTQGLGGALTLTGQSVELTGATQLKAQGPAGGGEIRIGGGQRGENLDVRNAQQVLLDAGTQVLADATGHGAGGRVIVWSDQRTEVHGTISAQGGPEGGDGGFVETSSAQVLQVTGRVSTAAPKGNAGQWLLDPEEVAITSEADVTTTETSSISAESLQQAVDEGTAVTVESQGAITGADQVQPSPESGGTLSTVENLSASTTATTEPAAAVAPSESSVATTASDQQQQDEEEEDQLTQSAEVASASSESTTEQAPVPSVSQPAETPTTTRLFLDGVDLTLNRESSSTYAGHNLVIEACSASCAYATNGSILLDGLTGLSSLEILAPTRIELRGDLSVAQRLTFQGDVFLAGPSITLAASALEIARPIQLASTLSAAPSLQITTSQSAQMIQVGAALDPQPTAIAPLELQGSTLAHLNQAPVAQLTIGGLDNTGGIRVSGALSSPQQLQLTSRGAVQVYSSAALQASQRLGIEGSQVTIAGSLTAGDGLRGGEITVVGDHVALAETARITASGENSGGLIQLGGSWQNSNSAIRQAIKTTVASGARVDASATQRGDGGTIVVWSDIKDPAAATRAYGAFSANGGVNGGDGGRIETSGHYLDVAGIQISTSSVTGKTGLWLLDPTDILISSSPTSSLSLNIASDPDVYSATTGPTVSTLSAADLKAALLNSSVEVTTASATACPTNTTCGTITYATGALIDLGTQTSNTLTLKADKNIVFDGSYLNPGTGSLILSAPNGRVSGSGSITLGSAGVVGGQLVFEVGTTGGLTVATSAGRILNQTDASSSYFSGSFQGTGSLVKNGTGTLVLTRAYTSASPGYSGGTDIRSGSVALDADLYDSSPNSPLDRFGALSNSLGSGTIKVQPVGSSEAVLNLSGRSLGNNIVLFGGVLANGRQNNYTDYDGGYTAQIAGSLQLNAFSTTQPRIDVAYETALVGVNAQITHSQNSPGRLNKTGGGTLILSGSTTQANANDFTAGTLIADGVVRLESPYNLGLGLVEVQSGGTLDLNGEQVATQNSLSLSGFGEGGIGALTNSFYSGYSYTPASFGGQVTLVGSASINEAIDLTGSVAIPSGSTLTLGGNDGGTIFGVISGSGGLVKVGSGLWELAGSNTYSGSTQVNNGFLLVSGSGPTSAVCNGGSSNLCSASTSNSSSGGGGDFGGAFPESPFEPIGDGSSSPFPQEPLIDDQEIPDFLPFVDEFGDFEDFSTFFDDPSFDFQDEDFLASLDHLEVVFGSFEEFEDYFGSAEDFEAYTDLTDGFRGSEEELGELVGLFGEFEDFESFFESDRDINRFALLADDFGGIDEVQSFFGDLTDFGSLDQLQAEIEQYSAYAGFFDEFNNFQEFTGFVDDVELFLDVDSAGQGVVDNVDLAIGPDGSGPDAFGLGLPSSVNDAGPQASLPSPESVATLEDADSFANAYGESRIESNNVSIDVSVGSSFFAETSGVSEAPASGAEAAPASQASSEAGNAAVQSGATPSSAASSAPPVTSIPAEQAIQESSKADSSQAQKALESLLPEASSTGVNPLTPQQIRQSLQNAIQQIRQGTFGDLRSQAIPSSSAPWLIDQEFLIAALPTSGIQSDVGSPALLPPRFNRSHYNPAVLHIRFTESSTASSKDGAFLDLTLMPSQGQPEGRRVDVLRSEFANDLKQIYRQLSRQESLDVQNPQSPSRRLYSAIFSAIEPILVQQGITTLLISADRGLQAVPFAALHSGTRYFGEAFAFSLTPSLALTSLDPPLKAQGKLLAAGSAVFDGLAPLPLVPTELNQVGQSDKKDKVLNRDFTPSTLMVQAGDHQYSRVHIATHAEFLPGGPSASRLYSGTVPIPLTDFVKLRRDREGAPLDLISFSACRTALGDADTELGFVGLALQSGARSAVGTLWYVDDVATSAYFVQMYRYLDSGVPKAEALQLTRQAFIRGLVNVQGDAVVGPGGDALIRGLTPSQQRRFERGFANPYFWAGIELMGSAW